MDEHAERPRRLSLLERGSNTVMAVLKRLAGADTITEIAEFSPSSQSRRGLSGAFFEMMALLESNHTAFVLVSSAFLLLALMRSASWDC